MFLNMAGGDALNFRVIAYNTETEMLAATPNENTIGVEGYDFNGYLISGTAPENPTEGMLWIQIAAESPCSFTATKKENIILHPIRCQQYKEGVWENVVAYLYTNAEWEVFGRLYLHRNLALNGNAKFTNGYSVRRWHQATIGYSSEDYCTSYYAGYDNDYGCRFDVRTETCGSTEAKLGALFLLGFNSAVINGIEYGDMGKIDVTNFKTLTFTGLFEYENSNSSVIYGVWSDVGTSYQTNLVASTKITAENAADVVIDVSELEGAYYIGLGVRSARVRVDKIYLEM